jgi:hypothetical protein
VSIPVLYVRDQSTGEWTPIRHFRGAPGVRGSRWYAGTAITGTSTAPTAYATGITDAIDGDMYINTATSYVYKCTQGGDESTALWVYSHSQKGTDGSGAGDMTKAVYDADNDGIVDNAAKLGGLPPEDYAKKSDIPEIPEIPEIPSKLSDLTDDENHRLVTDAEKSSWNEAVGQTHTHGNKSVLDATTASYTAAEKNKLSGIEEGAQVNKVNSVNGKTGDITLNASDVSAQPMRTVVNNTTETTITLAAQNNAEYNYGTLTSLTVTYPTEPFEFLISFTAGTSITVSFPSGTKWLDGETPSWQAGKTYEISVKNGRAVVGVFS